MVNLSKLLRRKREQPKIIVEEEPFDEIGYDNFLEGCSYFGSWKEDINSPTGRTYRVIVTGPEGQVIGTGPTKQKASTEANKKYRKDFK